MNFTLPRFFPKFIEKANPFYKLLEKTKPFSHDENCEEAFLAFKKTIATSLILSWLKPGAPLLLYLSVANEVISSTLIQEEGKHWLPIYFTSRMLHGIEKRYQLIKKVALALITAAWRLMLYFQSQQVVIKMNYPTKQVLRKPKLAGRMVAWSDEISEFDIHYEPHDPIKT